MAPAAKKVCATCGVIGEPAGFGCLEVGCMIFLLCLGIIPGIIYAIYVDSRAKSCKSCGAKTLVPVDSPKGREITTKKV